MSGPSEEQIRAIIARSYRDKLLRLLDKGPLRFAVFAEDGAWKASPVERWCDGFWPGIIWLAWAQSGEPRLRSAAEDCLARLAPRLHGAEANYDLGFLYAYSFALGHRLTGAAAYRETALAAARRLCDFFSPAAEIITIHYPERVQAFGAERLTSKIDVMMNLTLLWWAYRESGEARFLQVARSHARRSLDCLLSEEGAAWELADFDPDSGRLLLNDRPQGADGASCWARGQAWAVYGFVQAAHHTGEAAFADAASRALGYWCRHVPAGQLALWDLHARPPRDDAFDASASAIVLAALVRARRWGIDLPQHDSVLVETFEALQVALAPDQEEGALNGGCAYYRLGQGLHGATVWGDYYLLEALCGLLGNGDLWD